MNCVMLTRLFETSAATHPKNATSVKIVVVGYDTYALRCRRLRCGMKNQNKFRSKQLAFHGKAKTSYLVSLFLFSWLQLLRPPPPSSEMQLQFCHLE